MVAAAAMAFLAIILAAASMLLHVTAMAVTITALAIYVTDSAGTGAVMCGAIGAPIMGPWCLVFFEVGGHDNYVSWQLAPPRQSGENVLARVGVLSDDGSSQSQPRQAG
jgi:hypothetical protein